MMEREREREREEGEISSVKALVVGVFASGLNVPTWKLLKLVMVALVISLTALFYVTIQSASILLVCHVAILLFLAGALFYLLAWFVSETGTVPVGKQLQELNMSDKLHPS